MSERKPAFYALSGGGWRDWWTLLHPPYTIWHLSCVGLGAAAAPKMDALRLAATLVAFFLAVGLGAHALDERNGHPLRTSIGDRTLGAVAFTAIGGAIGIGLAGVTEVGPSLLPFIAFGGFIVWAYNTEAFGGRFHTDGWFALAWGAFPAVTASWAQDPTPRPETLAAGLACAFAAAAQRALSTPVRALRRRTRSVEGTIVRDDGSTEPVTARTLTGPSERALRALSVAMPLFALAAIAHRA